MSDVPDPEDWLGDSKRMFSANALRVWAICFDALSLPPDVASMVLFMLKAAEREREMDFDHLTSLSQLAKPNWNRIVAAYGRVSNLAFLEDSNLRLRRITWQLPPVPAFPPGYGEWGNVVVDLEHNFLGSLVCRELRVVSLRGVLSSLSTLTNPAAERTFVSHGFLKTLSNLPHLTQLELYDVGLGSATQLGECSSLTTLVITDSALVDVSDLAKITTLQYLTLQSNALQTVECLRESMSLINLKLAGNSLTNDGLRGLEVMPKLRSLQLACPHVNFAGNPYFHKHFSSAFGGYESYDRVRQSVKAS